MNMSGVYKQKAPSIKIQKYPFHGSGIVPRIQPEGRAGGRGYFNKQFASIAKAPKINVGDRGYD